MRKILLTSLFIASCCTHAFCQDSMLSNDAQVIKVAESEMNLYLSRIPPGEDSLYGFKTNEDLSGCEIGRPYRVITFSNDFYSNDVSEDADYLQIQNQWLAPVRLSGQDRDLLTITGSPGNFRVTAFGSTELAKDLRAKTMVTDNVATYYTLRIPAVNADFFVAAADNSFEGAKVYPLSSAIKAISAISKAPKKVYTIQEVELAVKDAIKNPPARKAPSKKTAPAKKPKKIMIQSN